ncbi:hypothetical protein PTMSG1_02776 [Pyrenophora teres f. maculata]|nr:hypothetical protein PTMSG1_02776 [Pyrenophora teres f. maculata]
MVNTRNPLFTYFNARPAGSSTVPVMVTSNTMASTSAFVPITSSMAMATRSASGSESSTAADVGGGRKDKEDGLSASATGGLAAGVTVAGIAILALLWFLIRRRRMKRAQAVASVQPQFGEANGDTKDKVAYQHHNIYPATHELQGDDPSASTSELDSIRPVSELGSPGPVSEGFLHRNARERWSGNTALVKSPKLTDLSEGEEGEGQDETGAGGGLGGKRGSRAHRRFSSV